MKSSVGFVISSDFMQIVILNVVRCTNIAYVRRWTKRFGFIVAEQLRLLNGFECFLQRLIDTFGMLEIANWYLLTSNCHFPCIFGGNEFEFGKFIVRSMSIYRISGGACCVRQHTQSNTIIAVFSFASAKKKGKMKALWVKWMVMRRSFCDSPNGNFHYKIQCSFCFPLIFGHRCPCDGPMTSFWCGFTE